MTSFCTMFNLYFTYYIVSRIDYHYIMMCFQLISIMEELVTQLRSTLEDDDKTTRLLTCRALRHVFTSVGRDLEQDRLHMMYPDLLKRMDDSSDDVRCLIFYRIVEMLHFLLSYYLLSYLLSYYGNVTVFKTISNKNH